MAGRNQKKEALSQNNRVVPGVSQRPSRVSSAAGSVGSQSIQKARVEQRSNVPSSRKGARSQATSKRGKGSGGQGGQGRGGQGSSRSASPRRPAAVSTLPPPGNDTHDTQFIKWVQEKWSSLEAHQQQSIFGVLLLSLSLLLFGSLTVFRTSLVLSGINKFFHTFFGWSAYLLAIGLVAYSLAHLIEGLRKQHFIRWSLIIGLVVIWLLLLTETRLIFGTMTSGALGEILILPLLGWPPAAVHVLLLGSLLVAILITFNITFGHILMAAQMIQRILSSGERKAPVSDDEDDPSPYLGQRPRFSRYSSNAAAAEGTSVSPVPRRSGRRSVESDDMDDFGELEEDDGDISFEPEFEPDFEADFDEEDPLDDINVHKQKVGLVPRGPRGVPPSLDVKEHRNAVKGASQRALPFDGDEESPSKIVLKTPNEMEPLSPNPKRGGQSRARAPKAEPNIVSSWKLPELTLLNSPDEIKLSMYADDVATLARTIQETLRSFRVDAEVREADISIGPTVIRFGIRPTGKPEMKMDEKTAKMVPVRDAAGNILYETRTRVSRIMALQNDIALVLEAKTIRMEAPVPGRPYVGVEIPNKNSRLVTLREVLESKEYQAARAKSKLAVVLGRDVAGLVRVGDLARMPHLLIAGATGAGKSVMINTIVASILSQATPDDVRMLMVDPKMVELNMYNGIPHLLSPVVIEVDKVVSLLKNAISEMERRYRLFSQLGVRNLDGYRKMRLEKIGQGDTSLNNLPAIVIIIDELADLMMAAPEEVEGMICRLAQLARATGIHLVIATQRPSVDVITGLIKANIPTRISFMVSSSVDSRTIIDMGGAERLLGRGDMLYLPADAGRPERIQGAFLTDEEASSMADYWRQQIIEHAQVEASSGDPALAPTHAEVEPGWEIQASSSDEFELDDDLLDKAEEIVREYGRASISLLQRRLRVGYSRAARLIDLLEEHGIIGQSERGGRAREVLDSNGGYDRRGDSGGNSLADVADEIMAEERERDEYLRKQAASHRPHQLPPSSGGGHRNDDEWEEEDEE